MSETAPEAVNQDGNDSGTTSAADEFKPITSQDELNEALKDRLARERAKFKDYGDLKAKAAQLDSLTEASKTEQEKLMERISKLESDLSAKELAASIADVAREFGLSDKQAVALKYAPSAEAAREIAEGLAAEDSNRKKNGNRVPAEGTSTRPAESDDLAFARSIFAPGD